MSGEFWKRKSNFDDFVVEKNFNYKYQVYNFKKENEVMNKEVKFMQRITPIRPVMSLTNSK